MNIGSRLNFGGSLYITFIKDSFHQVIKDIKGFSLTPCLLWHQSVLAFIKVFMASVNNFKCSFDPHEFDNFNNSSSTRQHEEPPGVTGPRDTQQLCS